MKILFIGIIICCQALISKSQTGNVGIGTTAPQARLHVTDSNVVFSAADPLLAVPGNTPVSGAGARMMWYPGKAAFRTGFIDGVQWDKNNVGFYSFASGYNTTANNLYSTALGRNTLASGTSATSLGYFTIASGSNSTALGAYSQATANEATAMNSNTIASGFAATAMGFATIAKGDYSVAMGNQTKSRSANSLVIGSFNDTTNTNRLFEVGNGTGDNARANALTVLANGNTGFGTSFPKARLHVADSSVLFTGTVNLISTADPPVTGSGTRMMWYPQKGAFRAGTITGNHWDKNNVGFYSFAAGYDNRADGYNSVSMGTGNYASGESSSCLGAWSIAEGRFSTSIGVNNHAQGYNTTTIGSGNIAFGFSSAALGSETISFGDFSMATGQGTSSASRGSFTTGTFNVSEEADPYVKSPQDRIFQVGNGEILSTSNALTLLRNGNLGLANVNKPDAPIALPNLLGKKITLYGNGAAAQFGIGISTSLLQIYSDVVSSDIAFGYGSSTSFSERMRIRGNGKVGIGTSTATKQLEVIGPGDGTPVTLMIGNRSGFGPTALEFVSDYGATNQWRPGFIKTNDLGVYTGALEFFTNGSGFASLNGSVKGFEVRNGAALTATGSVGSYCDARLKNNTTLFTDGLNVITKINPVQFYYNKDAPFPTDKQQTGIIAQELEMIAPYMVDKNKQNGFEDLRSVNNQAYVFLLINAVKEQQVQIEKLQQEMNELKTRMKKVNEKN